MRSAAGRAGGLIAFVAILLLLAAPADAGGPRIQLGDEAGTLRPAAAEALIARAAERGEIPVIVIFDLETQPVGLLSADDREAQAAAIAARQQDILARLGNPEGAKLYTTLPYLALWATPAELRLLLDTPGIVQIVEDVPERPNLNESAGLINAPTLWRRGSRGTGQEIAVIDTGVQWNHLAFRNRIVHEECYAWHRPKRKLHSLCPENWEGAIGFGVANDCPLTVRGCGHGTHVSGIALGNRAIFRGVANDAGLVAFKIVTRVTDPEVCGGWDRTPCAITHLTHSLWALERVALLAAEGRPIAAVNLSLGGGAYDIPCDDDPRKPAVDNLRAMGIATIISSGNNSYDGWIGAPACISTAVAVGATTVHDMADDVWLKSNHSPLVDLMAPGLNITAPVPHRTLVNRVDVKSGTSMAAPHVAGAWALLKQRHPKATVNQILDALVCTGVEVSREGLVKPRIDVLAADRWLSRPVRERVWNFRTDRQAEQWVGGLSLWRRQDNMLHAYQVRGLYNFAHAAFCAGDQTVTASMRLNERTEFSGATAGLILRATARGWFNVTGIVFAYDHTPQWEGSPPRPLPGGKAGIYAFLDADMRFPYSEPETVVPLCFNDAAGSIRRHDFNTLRVISTGGEHRFLINGVEVCRAEGFDFRGDRVMVFFQSNPGDMWDTTTFDLDRIAVRAMGVNTAQPDVPSLPYVMAPAGGALPAAMNDFLVPPGFAPPARDSAGAE